MRTAKVERQTNETQILVELDLDGKGKTEISTGIGFFDHMIEVMAKQALFDIRLSAKGDLETGQHHTVEDAGIVLGKAFAEAVGDKRGIARYGFFVLPMDDSTAVVALDISGRGKLVMDDLVRRGNVEGFETEVLYDFLEAFALNAGITLQLRLLSGRSTHHDVEAIFKGLGKALRIACSKDPAIAGEIPSTKGIL